MGELLGESERKNIYQMANNSIGVVDNPWQPTQINQGHLEIIDKPSQTKFKKGFSWILDNSGHGKSGNFTSGVRW